ncbi:MAG: hypothetical protein KY469_19755 [Actinobacteria bacterium]|nr:hypothetical protein [Actinomycetota bacterium]
MTGGQDMLASIAANIGKGLAAGLAGTAAMTISSTLEMKLRDRGASSAPADAASELLDVEEFSSDEAEQRFGRLVHWAYGTGWGAARGIFATFLAPAAADVAHFAAVWGGEQVMLPALEVAPPATQWGKEEVAVDAWHHLVYVAGTGLAYRWLDARS